MGDDNQDEQISNRETAEQEPPKLSTRCFCVLQQWQIFEMSFRLLVVDVIPQNPCGEERATALLLRLVR